MTPPEIRFHPAAADETEGAFRWYQQRSPTAAAAFLIELERTLARIVEAPQLAAPGDHATRRVLLRRFPFAIVYRVTGEAIEVIAVAHGRRRPGYWRSR